MDAMAGEWNKNTTAEIFPTQTPKKRWSLSSLFSLFSSDRVVEKLTLSSLKTFGSPRHGAQTTKSMEVSLDSDGDVGSDALNSSNSQSSSSSCERCSSLSRLSFDTGAAVANASLDLPSSRCRPHRASDAGWGAIRDRRVGPRDFKLVRRIGSGDVGTVYLCRLRDEPASSECVYAMKVVDKQVVAKKKKLERAETEKRILKSLDHPFLPTLYAHFDASPHYSCVVMEYCSGGDLHSLRHRQPGLRFPVASARFYAAEVLIALEYLHMLGIVYRDLKPENVLIRSDGHIMLSDFDLSLESTADPVLEHFDSAAAAVPDPPSTSCIPDGIFFRRRGGGGGRTAAARRFVAEPVEAWSCSFVGTHEYVAPEVASGRPHGSAVDWWAYGIFLYELLYGRTPFAGPTNDATLKNIVRQAVSFPPLAPATAAGSPEPAARDLIAALLVKDPAGRLGFRRGAADVKAHPFFKGLNLALMRSCRPPVVPGAGLGRAGSCRERQNPGRFDYF